MLITRRGLAVAAALLPVASPFFIWDPPSICEGDRTCHPSKPAIGSDIHARSNGDASLTVPIVQKLPAGATLLHEVHESKVRNTASRLRKKYMNRPTRTQVDAPEERDMSKRANTYSIQTAATPSQTHSAGINQDGTDYSYFAQVLIGSKSTPMYMLLDTGASSTWVMGDACTSEPCTKHNTFGPAESTTYNVTGDTFSITYGSGTVAGDVATDSLSIAGLNVSMPFGIANTTSDDFNSFPMDGILGLAQTKGSTPNFLETLTAAKLLQSNIFGISINRASDGPNNGEINFGAVDSSRFQGSIGYIPVADSSDGEWAIPLDSAGFGDKQADIGDQLAYIDTGTSYIFAPPEDAIAFHAVVPGSQSSDNVTFLVPCKTTTPATVTFGGVSYDIDPIDWVGFKSKDPSMCTSNIYGHSVVADGGWLLGDTFLKNVYAVFDVDENRIGFAQKKSSGTAVTSTSSTGGTTTSPLPSSSQGSISSVSSVSSVPPDDVSPTSSNTKVTAVSSNTPSGSQASDPESSAASTTPSPSAPTSLPEGLNGHQSSGTSGSPLTDTTSTPSSTPDKSSAVRPSVSATLLSTIFLSALSLSVLLS
ncbi:aspartic peptidase domain-containing protein [Xylogone sp. PMI_703]|nr:aspartic peptidase domain-containing protein [Xylogone sp. PMI_703]